MEIILLYPLDFCFRMIDYRQQVCLAGYGWLEEIITQTLFEYLLSDD